MWIVIVLIALAVALVVWRAVVVTVQRRRSRPIDSGRPHLTDIDPHPPDHTST
jgi:hypothetical protein